MKKIISGVFIFILALQSWTCSENKKEKPVIEKPLFGLFVNHITGYSYGCDAIKQSMLLNNDSSFVMRAYCLGDSTSDFKPILAIGKWSKENDSILIFSTSDGTFFKVLIMNDSTIQKLPEWENDNYNYPYRREGSGDSSIISNN